jgi:hypothetical protein
MILKISESEKKSILELYKKNKDKEVILEETVDKNKFNPNSYLIFNGDSLNWVTNGSTVKSWSAVSGRTWKNTPMDLDSWSKLIKGYFTSDKEKDFGPIPPGSYTVGQIESRKGNTETISSLSALWAKITGEFDDVTEAQKMFQSDSLFSRIGWGNHRATIKKQSGTETYGRGGFYIHGGSIEGSMGCIDLSDEMDDFAKYYGTWLATTGKKEIGLEVIYD